MKFPITNISIAIQAISPAVKFGVGKQFDLCLLEEMDDREYTLEILGIFLRDTPAELMHLDNSCSIDNFKEAHKTAHKLKSCTGLLQAKNLHNVLIKIEETSKAETKGLLAPLAAEANSEFRKIASLLQVYLDTKEQNIN